MFDDKKGVLLKRWYMYIPIKYAHTCFTSPFACLNKMVYWLFEIIVK